MTTIHPTARTSARCEKQQPSCACGVVSNACADVLGTIARPFGGEGS
jgi:hypothetical protein